MTSLTSPLYLLKGISLLLQPGIRRYVIMPLLVNFIIFALFIIFGISQFSQLIEHYLPDLPQWLQWIEWLLWPLFIAGFIATGFFFCLMVASLIAAPFNGFLAEAVERKLRPDIPATNSTMMAAAHTIGPALVSEVRKFSYFIIRALRY